MSDGGDGRKRANENTPHQGKPPELIGIVLFDDSLDELEQPPSQLSSPLAPRCPAPSSHSFRSSSILCASVATAAPETARCSSAFCAAAAAAMIRAVSALCAAGVAVMIAAVSAFCARGARGTPGPSSRSAGTHSFCVRGNRAAWVCGSGCSAAGSCMRRAWTPTQRGRLALSASGGGDGGDAQSSFVSSAAPS
ncbi:hypothetical protein EDB92DRAFT_1262877 [Lactarius akahatsu]|uniref:Uncharacterized protein n=1 Tax=Lactarius akahatsu TaxID=416441 RepID=A0AAD4Q889_9AGAM|nr:hypothetical protein EDB92DRAFT_1262877 [Lactarius akahatsu]